MNEPAPIVLTDPGVPPKLVKRHKNALTVDPSYQRSMDSSRSKSLVEKIAREFHWRKFGALTTTESGFIIDGQHRHAGAMLRPDIDAVPCLVYDVDIREAAAIFVGMNRDRVNITPQAIYKAELMAGHPEAMAVKSACDEAGVELILYGKAMAGLKINQTQAISTVRSQVRHRPAECIRALKCCIEARVILTASAIQAAFRHTVTYDDDELTLRMLRQTFLKHASIPADESAIPAGFLKDAPIVIPDRPPETVGGVQVRRFEVGGLEGIIERTLRDAGYRATAAFKGHPPKKVMLIDGAVVPMERAIARANEIRAKKGLPAL